MNLAIYRELEEADVDWMGHIPRHWSILKLKHICAVYPSNVDKKSYEGDPQVQLCNYTDVYYNDRITSDLQFMTATATSEQIEKFSLRSGDVIITKDSETADDIAIPAYVPQDLPGVVCGYHLSMLRPLQGTCGAFIKWLFDSRFVKASVAVRANGLTRVGLGQYALDNLKIPFPPLPEQTAIATFLDHETSRIDTLVEEQKRLIELLKEKRQAVISHAVTKGLNPDAPMKNTGIEWLGEVPEHWKVKRLKNVAELIDGDRSSAYPSDDDIVEEGIPFLSSKNIVGYKFCDIGLRYISKEKFESLSRGKIEDGDLAITVRGTIGHVAIYDASLIGHPTAFINAQMMIIRPFDLAAAFLHSISESHYWQKQLDIASYGTAQQQLSNAVLQSVFIAVPPDTEREEISSFLAANLATFDRLASEAQRTIDLLQERRAALISAAVTGKIDVRALVQAQEAAE
ncbi:restriction endonuclease subunit S [Sinorhizobium meliloti]|uniref:restriction endonuclease subunit S n=1 Tax=Rhizobium meliloti TaxID=382 RepID=UPI000FD7D54A|nr:restriction endonuclease subunit S [Sinorhizobium meliloti]RVE80122.1 restriction endonuclease subunit S [Sinorhizobium meliloti]RVG44214.1 restriction endonuclease subunit S [Sinorhizobium meliloti]